MDRQTGRNSENFLGDVSMCVSDIVNEMPSIFQAPVPAHLAPNKPFFAATPGVAATPGGLGATPAPPAYLLGSNNGNHLQNNNTQHQQLVDDLHMESEVLNIGGGGDSSSYYHQSSASRAGESAVKAPQPRDPVEPAVPKSAWAPTTSVAGPRGPSGLEDIHQAVAAPVATPVTTSSTTAVKKAQPLQSILVKKSNNTINNSKDEDTTSQGSIGRSKARAGSQETARGNWARHSARLNNNGTLNESNLSLLAGTPANQSTFGTHVEDLTTAAGMTGGLLAQQQSVHYQGEQAIDSPFPFYQVQIPGSNGMIRPAATTATTAAPASAADNGVVQERSSGRPNLVTGHSRSHSQGTGIAPILDAPAPSATVTPSKRVPFGGGTPNPKTPSGGWLANRTKSTPMRGVSEEVESMIKRQAQYHEQNQPTPARDAADAQSPLRYNSNNTTSSSNVLERGHTPTVDRMRKLAGLAKPNRGGAGSVRTTDSWRLGETDSFANYCQEAEVQDKVRRAPPPPSTTRSLSKSVQLASAGMTPANKKKDTMRLPRHSAEAAHLLAGGSSDDSYGSDEATPPLERKKKQQAAAKKVKAAEAKEKKAAGKRAASNATTSATGPKKKGATQRSEASIREVSAAGGRKKDDTSGGRQKRGRDVEEVDELLAATNAMLGLTAGNNDNDDAESYQDYDDFSGGCDDDLGDDNSALDFMDDDTRALEELNCHLLPNNRTTGKRVDSSTSRAPSARAGGAANPSPFLMSNTANSNGGKKTLSAAAAKKKPSAGSKKIVATGGRTPSFAASVPLSSAAAPSRFGNLLNPNTTTSTTTAKGKKTAATGAGIAQAKTSRAPAAGGATKSQFNVAARVPPALEYTPRNDQSRGFPFPLEIRSFDLDDTPGNKQETQHEAGRGINKKAVKAKAKVFRR